MLTAGEPVALQETPRRGGSSSRGRSPWVWSATCSPARSGGFMAESEINLSLLAFLQEHQAYPVVDGGRSEDNPERCQCELCVRARGALTKRSSPAQDVTAGARGDA